MKKESQGWQEKVKGMIRYPGTGLYRAGIELKDLDLVLPFSEI